MVVWRQGLEVGVLAEPALAVAAGEEALILGLQVHLGRADGHRLGQEPVAIRRF